MLIPLTDHEHPLSKQMLALIAEHKARIDAMDARPLAPDVQVLRHRHGRTLVSRVLAQRGMAAAVPVI